MAEYIDREEAYRFAQDQKKKETGAYSKGWNNAMDVIKSAMHNKDAIPAADVRPVVHGEWIDCGSLVQCSNCKTKYPEWRIWPANYCPNCCADMREVDDVR